MISVHTGLLVKTRSKTKENCTMCAETCTKNMTDLLFCEVQVDLERNRICILGGKKR